MPKTFESDVVVLTHASNRAAVEVKPDQTSAIEQLLEEAKISEHAFDASYRAPEALPSEFTIVRLMLETLISDGQLDFRQFSLRAEVQSPIGRVSSSFLSAVQRLHSLLEVEEGLKPN